MVPLGFFDVSNLEGFGLLPPRLLFRLPIQLFCRSVICFEVRMAAWAMKAGRGSGVSVPLLLNMDMLRRAIALGLGWESLSELERASVNDANWASAIIVDGNSALAVER